MNIQHRPDIKNILDRLEANKIIQNTRDKYGIRLVAMESDSVLTRIIKWFRGK